MVNYAFKVQNCFKMALIVLTCFCPYELRNCVGIPRRHTSVSPKLVNFMVVWSSTDVEDAIFKHFPALVANTESML